MTLFQKEEVWLACILIAVGVYLMFRRKPSTETPSSVAPNLRTPRPSGPLTAIPPGVRVAPQPIMSESEASIYNMLRLAVKDEYLLLAQVPVWCLIDITAADPQARTQLMREIAFRRVEFALVHPGTLRVAKVVEIEEEAAAASPQREARDKLLNSLFLSAGIPLLRLDKETEYSVAALAGLLGIEPESLDA